MTHEQHILAQIETQSTLCAQAATAGRVQDVCDHMAEIDRLTTKLADLRAARATRRLTAPRSVRGLETVR